MSRSDTAPPNRRDIFAAALAMVGSAVLVEGGPAEAAVVPGGVASVKLGRRQISVVDLTHELTSEFNWSATRPRIAMDPIIGSGLAAGMNLNRLMLVEHTGTHIDVPRHFSNKGRSLGEVPIADLVIPLAVVDLRRRAASDPDAGLTVEDIIAWERRHGRLPAGCCVAINSGYDPITRMRAAASGGTPGSPGFTPQAADFLSKERDVKGIAVDAMSIDQGRNGPAYPVHQHWLRSGRWGIEGMTNLDSVPPSGAILIVGAAPIKEATGMPIRAIALFDPG